MHPEELAYLPMYPLDFAGERRKTLYPLYGGAFCSPDRVSNMRRFATPNLVTAGIL